MNTIPTYAALAIIALGNASNALGSDNEFMVSKAWAYSSTWVHGVADPDMEFEQVVGPPRHYVSAYQLLVDDFFGFQFQCTYSSVWARALDAEENPDECSVYLQAGSMRYSGPDNGFNPYSVASWEGSLEVTESAYYQFSALHYLYDQLTYGTEATHILTVIFTDVGQPEGNRGHYRIDLTDIDPQHRNAPNAFLTPGVTRIKLYLESYYPEAPYYFGFENQQAGVHFRVERMD